MVQTRLEGAADAGGVEQRAVEEVRLAAVADTIAERLDLVLW